MAFGSAAFTAPRFPAAGTPFLQTRFEDRRAQHSAEQKEGGEPERGEREADMAHFRNKKAPCGDNKWKNYAFNLEEGRRNNHEMKGRNSGGAAQRRGRQNGGRCNR